MKMSVNPDAMLEEGTAAGLVDRFALQHRLPNGKTSYGEALLRRRKAWYYEHEPRPRVSVIGARLEELAGLR